MHLFLLKVDLERSHEVDWALATELQRSELDTLLFIQTLFFVIVIQVFDQLGSEMVCLNLLLDVDHLVEDLFICENFLAQSQHENWKWCFF